MNTVVYYPYIHPTTQWLRLAALCWDKVYRMTTWDAPDDPDEIRRFDEALGGVLESLDVSELARDKQVKGTFLGWVQDRQKRLRPEPISQEWASAIEVYISKLVRAGYLSFLNELYLVDADPADRHRLPKKIRELFKSRQTLEREALDEMQPKRGRYWKYAPGETVSLPRDIGLHFLSLCAAKAAVDGNRDLAADGEVFTDAIFYDYRALRGEIATSILQAYLPRDLNSLEPGLISEFRTTFAAQRLKYQKEIQSLSREFVEVASEGELRRIKDRILEVALERVEETHKVYRRAKLEVVTKAFGVSIAPPAIATCVASALSTGVFAPAGIAAALSVFLASRLIEWDKAKFERNRSPWSYVLDSAKVLKSKCR